MDQSQRFTSDAGFVSSLFSGASSSDDQPMARSQSTIQLGATTLDELDRSEQQEQTLSAPRSGPSPRGGPAHVLQLKQSGSIKRHEASHPTEACQAKECHRNERGQAIDPVSLPKSAYRITFKDIANATQMIKGGVQLTPCDRSNLSELYDFEIYLKREYLQPSGSFKERGARNVLLQLTDSERKNGVIAASMGNHATALSYQAAQLGVKCTVVMPVCASLMKIKDCKLYGADVIISGSTLNEAKELALTIGNRKNLIYISGFDHPNIIAGQGSIGIEICEQVKDIDAVILPVGGGGLLGGVATAIKTINKNIKIIGVESARNPGFTRSLEAGTPTPITVQTSMADGLAVSEVGYNAFASGTPHIDKMLVVEEDWIALAILQFVEVEKCVVEGSGAITLAAMLSGQLDDFKGKRIVLVLTGGNIDTPVFGRCLEQGLVKEGRILKFSIILSDRPGGFSSLVTMLGDLGVSIQNVTQERPWVSDVHCSRVIVMCETRDLKHSRKVKKLLEDKYEAVFIDLPNELL